jgi:hypothetical protein
MMEHNISRRGTELGAQIDEKRFPSAALGVWINGAKIPSKYTFVPQHSSIDEFRDSGALPLPNAPRSSTILSLQCFAIAPQDRT